MKNSVDEKSLMPINEKNIFYKIKTFFAGIFRKKENVSLNEDTIEVEEKVEETERDAFIQSIRNIGKEEMELLELQKKYTSGKIKINDLTKEQIDSLSSLYIKQTEELKKSNERRRKRIEDYKQGQKND